MENLPLLEWNLKHYKCWNCNVFKKKGRFFFNTIWLLEIFPTYIRKVNPQSIPTNFCFRSLNLTFELNNFCFLTINKENLKHLGLFNVKLKKNKYWKLAVALQIFRSGGNSPDFKIALGLPYIYYGFQAFLNVMSF